MPTAFGAKYDAIDVFVRVDARKAIRQLRGLQLTLRPGWLDDDPPSWRFPFFSPRWRPFDWQVDCCRSGPDWLDLKRGEELAAAHGWE